MATICESLPLLEVKHYVPDPKGDALCPCCFNHPWQEEFGERCCDMCGGAGWFSVSPEGIELPEPGDLL